MFSLTLNATEAASLLLLNGAVLDVINGTISSDTIEELKSTQADLEKILFKKEKTLAQPTTVKARVTAIYQKRIINYRLSASKLQVNKTLELSHTL